MRRKAKILLYQTDDGRTRISLQGAGDGDPKKRNAAPRRLLADTAALVPPSLLGDLRQLIESARSHVAETANAILTTLYWQIGHRIRQDVLQGERAPYGKQIVSALGRELSAGYGSGYSEKNLWHMARFAEVFADVEIVSALRRELSWTHFKQLIYIDNPLKREFYAELCRRERRSTRTLEKKRRSMLFERTGLSHRSDEVIAESLAQARESDRITPDLVFRDPYMLDFLGLQGAYGESDLEAAILREMETFLWISREFV